jgi:hypothetical protein
MKIIISGLLSVGLLASAASSALAEGTGQTNPPPQSVYGGQQTKPPECTRCDYDSQGNAIGCHPC